LTNIKFVGEDKDSTIISYNDYSGKGKMETFDSYTLRVMGNNLSFENLTIENTAGRVGQAVALHVEGDRCVFKNCRFLGNQDTIFASEKTLDSYLKIVISKELSILFLVLLRHFSNVVIFTQRQMDTFRTSTPDWVVYGYVFKNCKLTADANVTKVYLGRPWRDLLKLFLSIVKLAVISCRRME
jgi:pectinesterase